MEKSMESVPGGVQAAIYIDDVHPYGNTVDETWHHTLGAIRAIVKAGMLLNLGKCTLLATDVVVLGYALCKGSYRLGDKALKKLISSKIPTTLRELQGVMGKLNYCSRFCPRYNARVAPLR
jgi:hypothetical protein